MAKIMLVEDDNNLREIYGARLLAEGHEIVAAKDGEEALAIAVKEKPDLIISDVMMPRISGFDMLDILRNAPETKETKVIMMTALSQAEDKARADQLGADRYLVKSQVTLEDVARVVKDVLEGKEETAGATSPVGASTEAAAPATAESAAPAPTAETPVVPAEPVVVESTPETAVPETVDVPPVAPPATPTSDDASTTVADDSAPATSPALPGDPIVPAATPAEEEETPALDPINASVAEQPAAEAVSAEPTPASPTVQPTAATPLSIKVELPPEASGAQSSTAADSAATTSQPEPTSETPASTPEQESTPTPESSTDQTFIGPNLTEALEQEEKAAEADAAVATPTEATTIEPPQPAIINGAPELGVVMPTSAEPVPETVDTPSAATDDSVQPTPIVVQPTQTPLEEPAADEAENNAPTTAQPSNPLDEDGKKKLVLQPINDPTKGPDLNALLEKEAAQAAVINPAAASVINPAIEPPADSNTSSVVTPTVQPAPAPSTAPGNEHDSIAL